MKAYLLTMSLIRLALLKLTHICGAKLGGHCLSKNVLLSLLCLERSMVPQTSHPWDFKLPTWKKKNFFWNFLKNFEWNRPPQNLKILMSFVRFSSFGVYSTQKFLKNFYHRRYEISSFHCIIAICPPRTTSKLELSSTMIIFLLKL